MSRAPRLNIVLTEDIYNQLVEYCADSGLTQSAAIRRALERYLANEQRILAAVEANKQQSTQTEVRN